MITNKLKYLFAGLCIVFASCNPLEEVYDELDKSASEANQVSFAYELTAADYGVVAAKIKKNATTKADTVLAEFIEDNEVLTSDVNTTEFIPEILESNFPHLGNTSAIQVRYKLFQGEISEASQKYLEGSITLTKSDYVIVGGDAEEFGILTRTQTPDEVLPVVLADVIQEVPSAGDVKLVHYEYLDTADILTPVPVVAFKAMSSADDTTGYTQVNITMDAAKYQAIVDYVENTKGSEWIDSFGTLDYYFGSNSYFGNFDTRISKRESWAANTNDNLLDGSASEEEDSTRIAKRVLEGLEKFLGLTYTRAESATTVYNIEYKNYNGTNYFLTSSFILGDEANDGAPEPKGEKQARFYTYDGSKWMLSDDIHYFLAEDYNTVGITGKYLNFSDDNLPENYLPIYLSNRFPYAQEGDSYAIAYKYYNGSKTETIVETYSVNDGMWVGNRIIVKEEQYIKSEDKWNLDPTIIFTMTSADYQIIVDAVKSSNPSLYDGSFGTQEWLYGAGSFYSNFDIRVSKRQSGNFVQEAYAGMTQEEAMPLLMDKVVEGIKVLLKNKYPTLPAQVNGIDVFVKVAFKTYNGSATDTYMVELQSKGGGTFELVEGPTKQN